MRRKRKNPTPVQQGEQGDVVPVRRMKCVVCGHAFIRLAASVEQAKMAGCPACGGAVKES